MYPFIIGLLSYWLYANTHSKIKWFIVIVLIVFKQTVLLLYYAFVVGEYKYMNYVPDGLILLIETIISLVISYLTFLLFILFYKKTNNKKITTELGTSK